MPEVFRGVHPASVQEHICGTDHGGVPKGGSYVEIIILLQEGIRKDAEDVPLVGVPVFVHELGGDSLKLDLQPLVAGHVVVFLQSLGNGVLILPLVRPYMGVAGVFPPTGVYKVKDVLEARRTAGGVNEGDARGPAPHIPPHTLIPDIILRAGGGGGALGVNKELLMEGVLVEPRRRFQKGRPLGKAVGDLVGGAVGKLGVHFQLTGHLRLPLRNPGRTPIRRTPRRSWR